MLWSGVSVHLNIGVYDLEHLCPIRDQNLPPAVEEVLNQCILENSYCRNRLLHLSQLAANVLLCAWSTYCPWGEGQMPHPPHK